MIICGRRAPGIAVLILLAASLAACGDSEADQRKAFVQFLQTRIVDKPGVHVPRPTADTTKSFGPYAEHYAVITDFAENPEMTAIGAKIEQVMQKASIRSVREFVDHRAEFKSVMDDIVKLRDAMNRALAKTNAARAALKQPDDLKAVYDKAFDKDVIAPAQAINDVVPIVTVIASAGLKLGDYIDSHRLRVTMSGNSLNGKDAQTAKDLEALIKALNAQAARFQEAQRRLRLVLTGS